MNEDTHRYHLNLKIFSNEGVNVVICYKECSMFNVLINFDDINVLG